MICGEVNSQIHWGREVPEVLALLKTQYGIEGDEANAMIADALAARQREIRKKALLRLIFAILGLAIAATFFVIKSFSHSTLGGGTALFGALGAISLLAVVRSIRRLLSGECTGPA